MSRIQKWLDSLRNEMIQEEDFQKVKSLYRSSDYTKTLTELISSAKAGGRYAQYALGLMYADGDGVRQDDVKAVRWFHLAAEAKCPPAQYNLGEMYYSGRGVAKDYKEAVMWYKRAAGRGDADAKYKLGLMYETGDGVPQDYKEAVQFYESAISKGNAAAAYNLGLMHAEGRGVRQSDMETWEQYKRAANGGNADAQNELGKKYIEREEYNIAYLWFNLAAAQGHEEAKKHRDSIAKEHMSSEQIAEAQKNSREFSARKL